MRPTIEILFFRVSAVCMMTGSTNLLHISSNHALEEGSLLLPRDIFLSQVKFEAYMHRYSIIALLLCNVLLFGGCLIWDKVRMIYYFPLNILLITLFSVRDNRFFKGVFKSTSNKMEFLEQIVANKPGTCLPLWDSIAVKLNRYFFANGSTSSPYFFYDGENCLKAFRRLYLLPYLNNVTEEDKNKSICVDHRDKVEQIVHEAMVVYQEGLRKQWSSNTLGYSDKETSTPSHFHLTSLPSNIFENKLKYYWKTNKVCAWNFVADVSFLPSTYRCGQVYFVLQLIFMVFSIYMFMASKNEVMTISKRFIFLQEVDNHAHIIEDDGWDLVAVRMNEHLSNGEKSAPYFFYDGNACFSYFRTIFGIDQGNRIKNFKNRLLGLKIQQPELEPYINQVVERLGDAI